MKEIALVMETWISRFTQTSVKEVYSAPELWAARISDINTEEVSAALEPWVIAPTDSVIIYGLYSQW